MPSSLSLFFSLHPLSTNFYSVTLYIVMQPPMMVYFVPHLVITLCIFCCQKSLRCFRFCNTLLGTHVFIPISVSDIEADVPLLFLLTKMIATFLLTPFGLFVILTIVPTLQWSTLVHLGKNRTGRSLQVVIVFNVCTILHF
jgi:uncharacterized CHY-type Zn-finger protein